MVKELRPGDEGTICKGVECFVLSYVGLLILRELRALSISELH